MSKLFRFFLPLFLILFGSVPAFAQGMDWTISEAKGAVVLIDARGERRAEPGAILAPGAIVRTKAQSIAVLVRGREFVTLRQNAQIRIAPPKQERSLVQIIQDYGSALFNFGKQADPHFGVETPYLVAVVKGTTFIIAVNDEGATLQVTEGAVEASTLDGGARELILPGAVAMIAANDNLRLVVEGEGVGQRVVDSPARSESASASAAAAPTAGADAVSDGSATPASAEPSSENRSNRIDGVIASSPADIGSYSGGFASGQVSVLAAAVVSENTARGTEPALSSDGGRVGGTSEDAVARVTPTDVAAPTPATSPTQAPVAPVGTAGTGAGATAGTGTGAGVRAPSGGADTLRSGSGAPTDPRSGGRAPPR